MNASTLWWAALWCAMGGSAFSAIGRLRYGSTARGLSNMRRISSKSPTSPVIYRAATLPSGTREGTTVTDRQERVPRYCQAALTSAKVILIGAGGLGGEIGEALVRKGVGHVSLFDMDVVEPTNLNRQKFYARDLYQPKAHRLAKNLAAEGFCGSVIAGYNLSLQDAIEREIDLSCQVAIVGVDNNPTRVVASRFFRQAGIPVVFTAVSADANQGYAFVQQVGEGHPCFGCLFPKSVNDETWPCPGTPAIKDILKVVAGIVVYAVDSLLMPRRRMWNFKSVYLDGFPGNDWPVERREDCQLCGSQAAGRAHADAV
jgi:molybdopterin/thiamine biosynthesis adenylyltransferase